LACSEHGSPNPNTSHRFLLSPTFSQANGLSTHSSYKEPQTNKKRIKLTNHVNAFKRHGTAGQGWNGKGGMDRQRRTRGERPRKTFPTRASKWLVGKN
jgi:hypothetical protein